MNTTNNIEPYDPYELMITPSNKKGEMIIVQIAISNPNLDIVRNLIALGANLDWQNDSQFSPLHSCAAWKNPEIARMLINAGADMNMRNKDGY
jgi:ankyrin repeat protein